MHEEECVLLKESNIEDPLGDPLGEFPDDNFHFQSDNDKKSNSDTSEEEQEESEVEEPSSKPEPVIKPTKKRFTKEKPREEDLIYPCDECDRKFATPFGVSSHKRFHGVQPRRKKKYGKTKFTEYQLKCKICTSYCTLSRSNFQTHMKRHEKEEQKFLSSERYQFRCELCLAPAISKERLRTHMEIVHSKETYKCRVCYMVFKARSTARRHLRNFHPDVAEAFIAQLDTEIKMKREKKKQEKVTIDPEQRKQIQKEKRRLREKEKRRKVSAEKREWKNLEKLQIKNEEKLRKLAAKEAKKLGKSGEIQQVIKMEPELPMRVIKILPVHNEYTENFELTHEDIAAQIKQEPEIEIGEEEIWQS